MINLKLPEDSFFNGLKSNNEILNFGKLSRDIALNFIKERRSVVDIGSHIGISVIHWAETFQRVYAFEPMKDHYDCLVENTKNFDNITYYNYAISNENTEKMATYRTSKNSGSFQLLDEDYQQPSKKSPRKIYSVETKKLDEFNLKDVDLIKIDVEGWELEALRGSVETILKNTPVLIVEFTGGNSKKSLHRYDVNEYYKFIEHINYVPVGSYDDDIIYIRKNKWNYIL